MVQASYDLGFLYLKKMKLVEKREKVLENKFDEKVVLVSGNDPTGLGEEVRHWVAKERKLAFLYIIHIFVLLRKIDRKSVV